MFDQYVQAQAGNPRWRRAMGIAAVASGATTSALIVFMWVANKMNIRRVDPPSNTITLVQLMTDEATPPPPPPPPPPAGGGAKPDEPEEKEDIPEEEVPLEEEVVQPDDTPKLKPIEKAKPTDAGAGVPDGVRGGVPGGVKGGVLGGTIGGQIGGVIGGVGTGIVATKREAPKKDDVVKVPIQSLRKQALYSANPPDSEIAKTMSAKVYRRPGSSHVSFCVSETGKVEDVKTVKPFPNDPQIDRLCVDAVKKWRFKPWIVNGKPRRGCSTVQFDFEFK